MSSTSSSECECEECWQYGTGYSRNYEKNNRRTPFYPTMGHPLIYYAQVPQPVSLRHRGRESRRDSPNCFVKAFRWYTQERVPNTCESPNTNPGVTEFAAWLDAKYNQFLQDSQIDQKNLYHLKLKQTSIIETTTIPNNKFSESVATTKRFMRVKSPWRKKRRAKSNEVGQTRERSNPSCQYILQPKDLSRPASECCHPSKAISKSETSKKSIVKSQSFSNISDDRRKGPIDVITTQKGDNIETIPRPNKGADTRPLKEKAEVTTKKSTRDIACQFSAEKILKVDAATQSDFLGSKSKRTSNTRHQCCCQKVADHVSVVKDSSIIRRVNISNQCSETKTTKDNAQTQYEQDIVPPDTTFHNVVCTCDVRAFTQDPQTTTPIQNSSKKISQSENVNEQLPTKNPVIPLSFSDDAAQTSDHSIDLANDSTFGYPMFMKIVCADKLSEEK